MTFYLVFGLCFLHGILAKNVLPDTIPRCYRNDPNLNNCLLKATETIRPQIIHDIPELSIIGLDPYVLPELTVEQASNNLNFKTSLKNLTINGISNYTFTQFDFDPKTLTLDLKFHFKNLRVFVICQIAGRILLLPLNGEGDLLVSPDFIEFSIQLRGRLAKIKKVNHYHITNMTMNFSLKNVHARFEKFIGVNPEIIEGINNLIENNAEELMGEFISTFKEFMLDVAKNVFSNIVKKVPYDEMFPISDKFPPLNTI